MKKKSIYKRIKEGLVVATQVIIAAPVRLPGKVVAVAKYVALALGLLAAVEGKRKKEVGDEDKCE